jgi:hypothetical protein
MQVLLNGIISYVNDRHIANYLIYNPIQIIPYLEFFYERVSYETN